MDYEMLTPELLRRRPIPPWLRSLILSLSLFLVSLWSLLRSTDKSVRENTLVKIKRTNRSRNTSLLY